MRGGAPVLVVDDDPLIRTSISEILDLEGYPVATAANGAEALESVEQSMPSLVLLDMRMPVMDGWGFAGALGERGIHLPILVMTAAQSAETWAREEARGYLAKPSSSSTCRRRGAPPNPGLDRPRTWGISPVHLRAPAGAGLPCDARSDSSRNHPTPERGNSSAFAPRDT